jgi:hypothetical protein
VCVCVCVCVCVAVGDVLEAIGKAGMIEHMAEDTLTSNHEEVQRQSLHLCVILSAHRDLKERCLPLIVMPRALCLTHPILCSLLCSLCCLRP